MLTQYKNHSLDRHITQTWRMSTLLGNYVTPVPAQQRLGPRWFSGSADAIYQSLNLVYDEQPDYILVFGADHIYRMDPRQMLDAHIESGASATVAGIHAPLKEAHQFGVIKTASDGQAIAEFLEKPKDTTGLALPGHPDQIFASMGNYCFTTSALLEAVKKDAYDDSSAHDMGGNIVPMFVGHNDAQVYDFDANQVPGATERDRGYWRDVGTLDAYYEAHMDLISVHPIFNLYNHDWPIYTHHRPLPPAKIVHDRHPGRRLDAEQRRHRRRLAGGRLGALAAGPHRRAGRGHRQRADGQRHRSAPARSSATPSSTRTSSCRRARASASTSSATRPGSPSATTASSSSARTSTSSPSQSCG